MPTNKLWLEHTERAAWDSVEALRERLSKAEARLQALLPNVEQVPELLDLLQLAGTKHCTGARSQVEIVTQLLDRLDSLKAQLDATKTPEPTVVSFDAPPPRPRLDSDDIDERHGSRFDESTDISDFTHSMRRRQEGSGTELPRDLNRLLGLAETKLDDLAELEGVALREAAVELAILAARIYEASSKS